MLRIFAKFNTDEKVAIIVKDGDIVEAQKSLNKTFGGQWIFVDTVNVRQNEILHFNDGYTYKGLDGIRERYTDAIKILI